MSPVVKGIFPSVLTNRWALETGDHIPDGRPRALMVTVSDVFCPFAFQVIVVFTPTGFGVLLLWPSTFWCGIGRLRPPL
jgi:hypothetical protein